jgi:hypothetical protein
VADEAGRQHRLALGAEGDAVGERGEAAPGRKRLGAPMTGEIRHEHTEAAAEDRGELRPVRRRTAEAVHEHDRRALTAHEVADAAAANSRRAPLEGRERFCIQHQEGLSLRHGSERAAVPRLIGTAAQVEGS